MATSRLRAVPERDPQRTVTLVDSNVLLDVITDDINWSKWSGGALAGARNAGLLVINQIVYAEVSVQYARLEELDAALPAAEFLREDLPYTAGFLAGKAYLAYRRRGGTRRSPIPDFYIGAHAAVCGYQLLTRDASRYRTYFPTLVVVAPDA